MENLKSYEEYMYRSHNVDSKEDRHEKSKNWFIKKLSSLGESENDLMAMSLADLGRLYSKLKNKK
jgi:hypothetical protein